MITSNVYACPCSIELYLEICSISIGSINATPSIHERCFGLFVRSNLSAQKLQIMRFQSIGAQTWP